MGAWRRGGAVLVFAGVLVGCGGRGKDVGAREAPSVDAATELVRATNAGDAGRADASTTPPIERRTAGTARLVIEHVEAVCAPIPGAAPRTFKVGVDLLVETQDDADGAVPEREHVFCPTALADGGRTKPRLDVWRNCRRDNACSVTSDASESASGVSCGRDAVELVVEGGRTLLRGPFGERTIAGHPMRVLPVRKTRREAYVDC